MCSMCVQVKRFLLPSPCTQSVRMCPCLVLGKGSGQDECPDKAVLPLLCLCAGFWNGKLVNKQRLVLVVCLVVL